MNKKNVILIIFLIFTCGFIPLHTDNIYEIFINFFYIRKGIADSYVFESMMKFLFPQVIFFACYGDFFYVNIVDNASILFTRSKKNNYIVNKYARILLIRTIMSVLGVWLMIALIRIIQGGKINVDMCMILGLWAIEYSIYIVFSLIIINVLSFFIGIANATLVVMFIKVIEIISVVKAGDNSIYNIISKIMPISIVANRWNCIEKAQSGIISQNMLVLNFIVPSVLGIMIVIGIIKACGYILKRKEWL